MNAAAPNNPFQQAIVVSLPTQAFDDVYKTDTKQERVSAGLVFSLPGSWQASVDIGWNRSELDNFATRAILPTFVTAVRTGQVDILRDTLAYPLDVSAFLGPRTSTQNVPSTLKSGTARVGGPLFNLPGGPVNATVQLEHREMNVGQSVQNYLGQVSEIFPEKNQQVQSLYAELRAPIVSEANAVPGIRELELQLAGRRDEYTTRAGQRRYSFDTPLVEQEATLSSTNPTIALRYVPFESLALRASYGKGFMPPTIDQVTSSPFNSVLTVQDIRRGGETVSTLWRNFGGTVDLEPEESESWSAGFVFSPTWLPGLRLSADYTNIKKTNNIYQTFNGQFFVDNEEKFPYTVIREAPAAGDPFGVGRIIAIDTLLVNIARAEVEAVDLQLNYGFSTDWGSFDFYSLATWQTHYRTQVSPESPVVENVGITKDNPLKLRLNAGITWSLGNWSAGWAARYFDSYVVSTSPTTIANQGSLRVPSQNYHDLFLGYKTDAGNSWASGLELQLGFKNVLDKAPPFDATSFPYYSTYGDPYMASYYMSVKKSF
ncbi:MAG: TonB-dependent receptor [Oxalobacteraceae bacterium]|nr:MAG: TonB-dependent receptor [Oxalobacteraceae bacterium]